MSQATRATRTGAAWLAATLTLLLAGAAVAAPPPAKASFHVQVIEASKGKTPKIDPRLNAISRQLKPFKGQFNQFMLVREQTLGLQLRQSGKVALPGGAFFGVTMLGRAGGRVRYEIQMPNSRMKRSVAPGARTLDVSRNGAKLTIVSTAVR